MAKKCKGLLLLLTMLSMVLLCACSGSGEVKKPASASSVSAGNSAPEQKNEVQEETEAPVSNEITIAETVLFEADGVRVTAKGLEEGWMGPAIKVLVENDSDKNILLTADAVSVNGYMMPGATVYAEVAAGKKANESISLMSSELSRSGIDTVAEIQMYLRIQNPENWDTLRVSDLITLQTSEAGYVQPVDDSGDMIYDYNGIRVVCKGLKQDLFWDGTIVFYLENNSTVPVSVYAENVSVNGFMQDVGMWSDMRSGTRLVDGMYLLDLSDLELESIEDVEEVEFNLRIVNSDSWDSIATTDAIRLTFE